MIVIFYFTSYTWYKHVKNTYWINYIYIYIYKKLKPYYNVVKATLLVISWLILFIHLHLLFSVSYLYSLLFLFIISNLSSLSFLSLCSYPLFLIPYLCFFLYFLSPVLNSSMFLFLSFILCPPLFLATININ